MPAPARLPSALFLLPLTLLLLAPGSPAQQPDDAALTLEAQFDSLDEEIATARSLAAELETLSGVKKNILTYRLDGRIFRVLRRADDLAAELSGLPDDDAMVAQLRNRMMTDFEQVGDKVFVRIAELDAQIAEELVAQRAASGEERVLISARIDMLDELRQQYLEAMARHLGVRDKLGLSNANLRPRLELQLLLRAESLAGSVNIASKMIRDLRTRRSRGGQQAEIDTLLAYNTDRRAHYLETLRAVTLVMEGIGMDARDYKSLLIAEEGVSLQLFNLDVIDQLAREWAEAARSFAENRGPDLLVKVLLVLAILFLFRILARMARKLVDTALSRTRADVSMLLKNTTVSLTGGTVMLLGILIAMSQIGLSVGPMLAGLGIAGFIVGFALQDTLANFASGAMILIYRPYDVDDFVEVTGATGMVKKMNLVSTTILTFDNQTLVVPNSKIWGDVIKNVTPQKLRRVDLEFGIGYESDIPKAERILAEVAANHELVLDTPETNVRVHSLGDSSVNLILRPWVKTEDYWTVYWDLTREVKLRFDREGVNIPYPQRDVHIHHAGPARES